MIENLFDFLNLEETIIPTRSCFDSEEETDDGKSCMDEQTYSVNHIQQKHGPQNFL